MAGGGSFYHKMVEIFPQVENYRSHSSSNFCIFKENLGLMPKCIGLGLYHQKDSVEKVKEWKKIALTSIAAQTGCFTRDQLIGNVQNLLPRIQACYEDNTNTDYLIEDPLQQATNFAEDACFILYFFSGPFNNEIDDLIRKTQVIAEIFMPSNQIPLFLLLEIMNLYSNPNGAAVTFVEGLANYRPFQTLSPLALSFEEAAIINFLKLEKPTDTITFLQEYDHLLHLLHKSIGYFLKVPDVLTPTGLTTPTPPPTPVECGYALRNLEKYNIAFKACNGRVLFTKRTLLWSILYLPKIRIDRDTIPFHKSLITFDWKSRKDCTFINDLTFLFDCMVGEDNKDLFSKARIIQGDSKMICQRLKDLCEDLTTYYGDSGYHGGIYRKEIINELDEHSKNVWNEWMYTAWNWKGTILSALLTVVIAALTLMYTVWNWKGVLLSLGVLLLLVSGGLTLRKWLNSQLKRKNN